MALTCNLILETRKELLDLTVRADSTGGGPLWAVKGLVLKGNGRSQSCEVATTLKSAKIYSEMDILGALKAELAAVRHRLKPDNPEELRLINIERLRNVTKKSATPAETLRKLINKAKKRTYITIKPETTFKDLHIDSLEAVNIIVALEDELGIEIDDRDLKQISDMGSFIRYLESKVDLKTSLQGK